MSSPELNDMRKLETERFSYSQSMQDDHSFDAVLNNLFVDDSYIKKILRGDVQEPLNSLTELIDSCKVKGTIDQTHYVAIASWLKEINAKLVRYQRLTPYLFLLSQLMSLTNVTEKEAYQMKCRVSIMIQRDKLDIDEEQLTIEDINFYDGLKLLIFTKINDSVNGWKARLLTQPKKEFIHTFTDNTPQRKKRLGIF